MRDAQKPDHISLNSLINRINEGRFVIPDFQREFEWEPWDIKDLMRSIFLDYYVGSLLLWKGKNENFDALSCESIYGFNKGGSPEYIVLDGQQRLTAMYYAFFAPEISLPRRANRAYYFVRVDQFMVEEYDEAFIYEWLSRRISNLIDNPAIQYEEHIFPLSVIGAGGWDLPIWVQGYVKFWSDKTKKAEDEGDIVGAQDARQHAENAKAFGEHLKGITEEYQISFIELDRDLSIDKICDIFTQINSRGVRLDVFDLMNALLKPKEIQLKHMWREAKPRLSLVETQKMNVYILQVMSILRQAYCSPRYLYFLMPGQVKPVRDPDGTRRREVLVPDVEDFKTRWNHAVTSIESSMKLLNHPQEFGAISQKYLPYISIIPAFSALQAYVKELPPQYKIDAQRKICHWYWASVFTNRYSGAVESTTTRDFLDIKAWINDDDAEPALIQEFKARFVNLDLRREVKRGSSVYNGIFNLLVLQGARDWITGNVPQHDDLDDHHIVPDSWGKNNMLGKNINTILNRTPLTGDTNRNFIGDRLPNAYLPDLIQSNGEGKMRTILESHFISPVAFDILLRDPFTPKDFEEFILERQRTLRQGIESLLIKERFDLSPHLRDLDERIELIELDLRNVIARTLLNNQTNLPTHLIQKVDERMQRALRKNPSLASTEQFHTLTGKLEYFDLRELQDVLISKAQWAQFQAQFVSKDTLSSKFDQLAELRNGIRHSRTVDEVMRKEGEAAILWFESVLKKWDGGL